GVSFGDGAALGVLIATAIAVHNIPEGLAISLVLVPRGVSVARAAAWSVFSSLPQPLMAVPAYLLVEWFKPLLPVGLGFAAGAMIWMVAAQLLPDALRTSPPAPVAAALSVAAAAMIALQVLLLGGERLRARGGAIPARRACRELARRSRARHEWRSEASA